MTQPFYYFFDDATCIKYHHDLFHKACPKLNCQNQKNKVWGITLLKHCIYMIKEHGHVLRGIATWSKFMF
jgi:hypothetical protein